MRFDCLGSWALGDFAGVGGPNNDRLVATYADRTVEQRCQRKGAKGVGVAFGQLHPDCLGQVEHEPLSIADFVHGHRGLPSCAADILADGQEFKGHVVACTGLAMRLESPVCKLLLAQRLLHVAAVDTRRMRQRQRPARRLHDEHPLFDSLPLLAGQDLESEAPMASVVPEGPLADSLTFISDIVKTWAPHIPQGTNIRLDPEFVRGIAEWLEQTSASLRPAHRPDGANAVMPAQRGKGSQRKRLTDDALVKYIIAAWHLHDKTKLSQNQKLLLDASVSPTLRGLVGELANKPPTASWVSRLAGHLDAAYVVYWQKRWERMLLNGAGAGPASNSEGDGVPMPPGQSRSLPSIYLATDSSPRFEGDWLFTELHIVERADKLHDDLCRFISARKSGAPTLPTKRQSLETEVCLGVWLSQLEGNVRSELLQTNAAIQAHIENHVLIPAALASQRGSLAHKLHALLHSITIETGSWEATEAFFQQVVAVTTDMGSLIVLAPLSLT